MPETERGVFITLEGGEGTGKSTLLAGLAERFRATGRTVVETREPGGTPLAEKVRQLVLFPPHETKWSALSSALLMNTARSDHLEKLIRPALRQGQVVLSDRFADSTRAYQSVDGGVSDALLGQLEAIIVGNTRPDLTLILDADPEALFQRRKQRSEALDQFEQKDVTFHQSVREAFLAIAEAEPARCKIVNALAPIADVLDAAWRHVEAIGT